MDFHDVRDHLDQTFDFPVDHAALVEQVGDVELEGSTTDPETIETVLNRTRMSSYESAADVHDLLLGTVTDGYIGRKYYDDRSGSHLSDEDRQDVSL